MSLKQRKMKFKPKINLNHNINTWVGKGTMKVKCPKNTMRYSSKGFNLDCMIRAQQTNPEPTMPATINHTTAKKFKVQGSNTTFFNLHSKMQ